VFDRKGWGVGWLLDDILFDNQGLARAFIKNRGVFRIDGSYVGCFDDGFFRDRAGDAVGFLEGASGGPFLPAAVAPSQPPRIARVPTVPLDELVPPKPATPSLSWSKLDFIHYMAG
jgi:hypothetical protein